MQKIARIDKGFTLLEVMLVVLIIGVIASLAVYAMVPTGASRESKREAQILMAALNFAQQQAVYGHQPYGLSINQHSYQFYVYQDQWLPTEDKALAPRQLRSSLQLLEPKAKAKDTPNILLLPSKEPPVFKIVLNLDGYRWHLNSQPPQAISLTAGQYE